MARGNITAKHHTISMSDQLVKHGQGVCLNSDWGLYLKDVFWVPFRFPS